MVGGEVGLPNPCYVPEQYFMVSSVGYYDLDSISLPILSLTGIYGIFYFSKAYCGALMLCIASL